MKTNEKPPIISIRCLIEDETANVLVVERAPKGKSNRGKKIQLPGGKADDPKFANLDFTDRLMQNGALEVEQETGLDVICYGDVMHIESYIIPDGVHAGRLLSSYRVRAAIMGGEMRPGKEELAVSWLDPALLMKPSRADIIPLTRQAYRQFNHGLFEPVAA